MPARRAPGTPGDTHLTATSPGLRPTAHDQAVTARVEHILQAQEMAGERLVNRIRLAYGVLGLLMAVAAAGINTPAANTIFLVQGALLVAMCGVLFLVFRARRDQYLPWAKYATITFDITMVHLTVLAAARNHSGVIEYFHSFFPLVLVLWNLLSGLRYSVAACLYSAGFTALLSSAMLAVVVSQGMVPVSATSTWGQNAINIADEAMRVVFVSASGLVAALLASIARKLIRRAEEESASRAALERQKARLSKYLGGELAEAVVEDGFNQEGERRQATILFTDIRNFTSLAQATGPEQTVKLLNDYFTEMVAIVFRYGGTLDKFLGDGLMAVYNAPFDRQNAPLRAVLTALEMVVAVDRLNQARLAHGDSSIPGGAAPLRIGAGIASGEVIAGNIGSTERMEYTVIGDAVNLAARLETLNRDLRTAIVISEETHQAVSPWIPVVALPPSIKLKGIAGEHRLYAIDPSAVSLERLAALREMVLHGTPTSPVPAADQGPVVH